MKRIILIGDGATKVVFAHKFDKTMFEHMLNGVALIDFVDISVFVDRSFDNVLYH